jgi:hydrogenase expression/formation protein HypD
MDPRRVQAQADQIRALCAGRPPLRVMEVCGTHTVSLFRSGVRSLLPPELKLISGPGCPVCVTPQGYLDAALHLAGRDGLTICTYGDLVRVPGRDASLAEARADGARVVVCYGARDAVKYAATHPDEEVVFLAVGFETTVPATAVAVLEAAALGLGNFRILVSHKRVVPALAGLLSAGAVPLDGFLCPGHVSVIIGTEAYRPIVEGYGKACVVAGFEPRSMLAGIRRLAEMTATNRPGLDNVYPVAVRAAGNVRAQALIDQVFVPVDATWRAIGVIPGSGLGLREAYARFDAAAHHGLDTEADHHAPGCRCGEVIQGQAAPADCPLFRTTCTPARPIGPCMVSSEGTCAAWYKYAEVR